MIFTIFIILFIIICLLIVLLVLVQPAEGEGLASAFGGMGSDSFFGTKALTYAWKLTVVFGILLIILTITINLLPRRMKVHSSLPPPPTTPSQQPPISK